MRAGAVEPQVERSIGIAGIGCPDRPAGHRVDARCPSHGDIGLGRDHLPVGAVQHIEKAVLRRVHQHLADLAVDGQVRSEEHTSELQSLMRISYAVFCLKKKIITKKLFTTSTTDE